MKKLIMLFAFFGLVGIVSINAQACSKSAKACTKSTASKACCAKTTAAAAKLASMDDSIESKTCATSGKVSYVRKSVCAKSGKVSLEDVKYCTETKKFVNVSPSTKAAKATQTSTTATKKSCAKSCAKSCSKGKSVKATTAKKVGQAKLVKQEEQ